MPEKKPGQVQRSGQPDIKGPTNPTSEAVSVLSPDKLVSVLGGKYRVCTGVTGMITFYGSGDSIRRVGHIQLPNEEKGGDSGLPCRLAIITTVLGDPLKKESWKIHLVCGDTPAVLDPQPGTASFVDLKGNTVRVDRTGKVTATTPKLIMPSICLGCRRGEGKDNNQP